MIRLMENKLFREESEEIDLFVKDMAMSDMPDSDLQGAVEAFAMETGADEDELLDRIRNYKKKGEGAEEFKAEITGCDVEEMKDIEYTTEGDSDETDFYVSLRMSVKFTHVPSGTEWTTVIDVPAKGEHQRSDKNSIRWNDIDIDGLDEVDDGFVEGENPGLDKKVSDGEHYDALADVVKNSNLTTPYDRDKWRDFAVSAQDYRADVDRAWNRRNF